MNLLPYEIAEISAATICTLCFMVHRSYCNSRLLPILLLTVAVEQIPKAWNTVPYKYLALNICTLLMCLGYVWFLRSLLVAVSAKKVLAFGSLMLLLFGICNLFFGQGLYYYNSDTRLCNSFLVTTACLLIFWRIATSGTNDLKVTLKAVLLISTGLILFYCGNFILIIGFSWLQKKYPDDASFLYRTINHNLNVVLYGLLSLGLLTDFFSNRKNITEA